MPVSTPPVGEPLSKTARRRHKVKNRERKAKMRQRTNQLRRRGWWRLMCAAAQGRCSYCLSECDALTVDHIQPIGFGGTCDYRNLLPVCSACNRAKDDDLLTVFVANNPYLIHAHHPLGSLDPEQGWIWSELGERIVRRRKPVQCAEHVLSEIYTQLAGSAEAGQARLRDDAQRLRWSGSRAMRWPRRMAYRLLRCA